MAAPAALSPRRPSFPSLSGPSERIPDGGAGQLGPRLDSFFAREHLFQLDADRTYGDIVIGRFPIKKTLSNYSFSKFASDLAAGITIGIQLLPKGMAYAMMAGLSKADGVIVAMMSTLLYPICGSTPVLCVGPDPIICLLISNIIQNLEFSDSAFKQTHPDCTADALQDVNGECFSHYNEWLLEKRAVIGLIGVWTALTFVIGNLVNFGFISNFISKPIVDAFICSASLVIMLKQFHYCLNMHHIAAQGTFVTNLYQFAQSVPEFITNLALEHLASSMLALVTLIILFGLHFWSHSHVFGHNFASYIPAVLLVVLLGIGFTKYAMSNGYEWLFGPDHPQLDLVGEFAVYFQFGFKWPGIRWQGIEPILDFQHLPEGTEITLWDTMRHGFILAITSYMCSMIVSRKLAIQRGFPVDPNAELLGLGVANIGCCTLGGFPCGGILATSLAVLGTSAQTSMWSVYCAMVVTLLSQISYATAALALLPKAVLSAIVIETVIPAISFESAHSIGSVMALDIGQYAVTMIVCFLYGIEYGIAAGMFVAIFQMIYSGTQNRVIELGRLPRTSAYRNVLSHPDALVSTPVLIARVYDSLLFTNWYPCEESLQALMDRHQEGMDQDCPLVGVVINLTSCSSIDSTAAFGLLDFSKKHAKRGVAIRFSSMNDQTEERLQRVGIQNIFNVGIPYTFYETDAEAVQDIIQNHAGIHDAGSVHLSEVEAPSIDSHAGH